LDKSSAIKNNASHSPKRLRFPIWLQLCIVCTLIIIIVILTLSATFLSHQKEQLYQQSVQTGKITLNYFTAIAMIPLRSDDLLELKRTISKVSKVKGLEYAFIVNTENIIIAHSDNSKTDQRFTDKALNLITKKRRERETTYFNYQSESGVAILNLSRSVKFGDKIMGEAHVGVSIDFIEHIIAKETKFIIILSLLVIIIFDFIFAMLLLFRFSRPISKLVIATRELATGNFQYKVKLTRNDELGELADSINSMGPKLNDQYQMRQALELAEQLQRSLLPAANPLIKGLDIAAEIIFCDETGGDYYDFPEPPGQQGITVIVGDVTGHGLQAAFLMATVRAFLRQRASMSGDIADIVTDVNRQLNKDVGETGMFMTLFYAEIDEKAETVGYVRAGHDPAIVYDTVKDAFYELAGAGGPLLGGFEDSVYKMATEKISPGQILVICTDGLWEAHNAEDEMFGKERVRNIIRNHSNKSSEAIVAVLIDEMKQFRGSVAQEDDITLVIIKVEAD